MLWEIEELDKISQSRPTEIKHALNKFFEDNPDIKRAVIINAYLDKKINFSKAAEELGLHRLELQKQFESEGIPIRRASEEDVKTEAIAVRTWD